MVLNINSAQNFAKKIDNIINKTVGAAKIDHLDMER